MIVFFSDEAKRDLEIIGDHIAADSAVQARRFIRELQDKCDDLACFPARFPLLDRPGNTVIRRRLIRSYLIFYRVEAERLVIIRILHGSQDYEQRLFDT